MPLLDIDADAFGTSFGQRPFLVRHRLAGHPLFELPRLIELSKSLPPDLVEYNAGNIPVNLDPDQTPRNGLSVEETIRRIEECNSWMALKYVDRDPAYRGLLFQCLDEIKPFSEAIRPGMTQPESFIFISSAGAVTPYHMDPEHNFLLQVRGTKTMTVFDGSDRSLVGDEDLERFYRGEHRNMRLQDDYERRAQAFVLEPGLGVHVPVTFPHHVRVGAGTYSISFSITFRTPDLDRVAVLHQVNDRLRRRGYRPAPVGRSELRDKLKYQGFRVWRSTRRLMGRPVG